MEIKLNGFVREFTRRAIKIPPLQSIQGCDWVDGGECETVSVREKLIQSGDTLQKKLKYSLRSIDEIKKIPNDNAFCSIGPEFQRILKDPEEIKTVAEAFATWTGRDLSKSERTKFVTSLEKIISEDIRRRGFTIGLYVLYFTIALPLLVQQYTGWRNVPGLQYPLAMLSLLLLPLITSFYIHALFAERLRTSGILHILPLIILVGLVVYSVIVASGPTPILKTALAISQWVLVLAAVYGLVYIRRQYEECRILQSGGAYNSHKIILWGIVGLVIPAVVVSALAYTL
jgi:hypothetical protein